MAYCTKCGAEVSGAAFCPKCGQAQSIQTVQTGGAQVAQTTQSTQTGMAENVAGLLCYVLGFVTGLVFFLIDKRPFVRFHAAQSMVVFGGLFVLRIVLGMFFGFSVGFGGFGAFGLAAGVYGVIGLISLILWIVLMIKAYQGEKFVLPIAGGIAQGIAK
jgi:uncharacterized membrane protein